MLSLLFCLLSTARAEEAPGWALVMPFGVPQLAQQRTTPGLVFGGIQVAAFGAAAGTMVAMRQANEAGDIDRELTLRLVSVGEVAVGAGTWFASVTEASHHQDEARARADAARAWQAATRPPPPLPPWPTP